MATRLPPLRFLRIILPFCAALCLFPGTGLCQDSGDEGILVRGDRAEISITIRDSSGTLITTPSSVKLYKNGMPSDQSAASHGRVFFIARGLGEFTIVVEATGYKSTQKDVSIPVAGRFEVDLYLQRDLAPNETASAPGKPILAPEAQKALSKGAEALREGKLDQAEKEINKAASLAPGNPNVLYIQGMLYLKQSDWPKAEAALQKADQIDPNQPRVLSALGMAYCNAKKYEQAIPVLEKSIQLEPNASWETDFALAKAYYFHEQYEQALKLAQQAHSASHGTSPQVELLLAQCLTATGRYEDSAQILRDVLKQNPQAPEAATAQRWLERLSADRKIHP